MLARMIMHPPGGVSEKRPVWVRPGAGQNSNRSTPTTRSKARPCPCPGGTPDNSPTLQRWVRGFLVAIVPKGRLNVTQVLQYLPSQEAHHRTMAFQNKFIALLKKHGIEYDARYLWD